MVSPDWNDKPKSEPQVTFVPAELSAANALLARPVDRLAAVIVDMFVILAPLFVLVSAPFKKHMTLSYLMGNEADLVVNVLSMALVAVLLIVIYQTFMHFFFRATIGKMLFDVRVVAMFPGHKITLWDHFVRSWVWVGEVFCLLLPLLSVFSNPYRRPWHDRLCDTLVVSNTQAGVLAPAVWERALVRLTFTFMIALIGGVTLMQVQGVIDKINHDSTIAAMLERDSSACEVVTKNIGDDERPHGRLELAMTLYAAGLADRSCLESEVEREVSMQIPVAPITYLAQAFVYADEADVSNSYLDEVCETAPGSVECHMSAVVSSWSDEDWNSVEESITKAPRGSGYLEVWGVRHFMKQARYDRALELLNTLIPSRYLSEFSLGLRVRALYNSYRESEAETALLQAVTALPELESKELSSWMCAQQLQGGCAALDRVACQQIAELKEQPKEIDFEESGEALSRVLALECRNEGKMDYMSFAEAVNDEDWQTFFRANVKRDKGDRVAAGHLFSQLIFSSEAPEILKVEAARRWAQFADRAQTEDLFEQWRAMPSRELWVKTGNVLFRRMSETGRNDLALKVARYLMNSESLSPQALATLSGMVDESRKPASDRTRERVKELLDKEEP